MPSLAVLASAVLAVLAAVSSGPLVPLAGGSETPPPAGTGDDAGPGGTASAPPPPPPAAASDAADPARAILERAEAATEGMERFRADLRYIVEDVLEGRVTARSGRLLYERLPEDAGGDRLAVVFTSITENARRRSRDRHYAIQGRWLAEVDRESRVFVKRSIAPPGERFDPFDLGTGGFPLPVGQDPDEVLAQFTAEPAELPADGLLARLPRERIEGVRLVPRPDTELADDLDELEVFHDRETGIPLGIRVGKGAKVETVILTELERDPTFTEDELVRLSVDPPSERGWSVDIR